MLAEGTTAPDFSLPSDITLILINLPIILSQLHENQDLIGRNIIENPGNFREMIFNRLI